MEPNIPDPANSSPAPGPTRTGALVRVGIFAFLEIAGMFLFGPLMYQIAGYLVSAALSTFTAAAVANTIALRVFERGQLTDAGLGWSAASRKNLALGLAGGIGAAVAVLAIPLLAGGAELKPDANWTFNPASTLFLLIVLVFGAVGEELLFRGYGFQVLLGAAGRYATILPVSILFGISHSNNPNATPLALVNTTLWGLLFCLAFLRSRDLWLPIGLHYGWNVTLPLFGVNLSGFTMNVTGYAIEWKIPNVWSGGDYGPEAGLLCTLILGVLFALLFRAPVERQSSFLYAEDDEEVP